MSPALLVCRSPRRNATESPRRLSSDGRAIRGPGVAAAVVALPVSVQEGDGSARAADALLALI
jgi:hypothetical protein